MMTEDHVFVDSLGGRFTRPTIEAGWGEYFDIVPDYWIEIDRMAVLDGGTSVLIGRAGGTYAPGGAPLKPENRWQTPAVWTATVKGEKVAEWRIYADNEPIRTRMRAQNP